MTNETPCRILIIAQVEEKKIERITYELFSAASELSAKTNGEIHTVVIGADIGEAALELAKYTNVLYIFESQILKEHNTERYLQVIKRLCRDLHPDMILLAHNPETVDLAPGLAFELETDLITDCVDLDVEAQNRNLLCIKEVYGGNAYAVFENCGKPAIATIRQKGLREIRLSEINGRIEKIEPVLDESRIKVQIVETLSNDDEDFDKADVIVAGGRGIGGSDGVAQLQKLIEAFKTKFAKVVMGGSRPAIDEGWMPSFRQIGLTGEKVNPQIYFAVGISGALQHMSGIFSSKKIVAINSNPEAAIFRYADYGVVGDYRDILSTFTQKIRKTS